MGPRDWMETVRDIVGKIGNAGDRGGNSEAGTVFGKENEILDGVSDLAEQQRILSKEQIWGHWVTLGSVVCTVAVKADELRSVTLSAPAGAWFAYLRTYMSSYSGGKAPSKALEGTVTIEGKTYPIMVSKSEAVSDKYYYYTMGYTGLYKTGNSSVGNMVWDGFIPLYPRFMDGDIEVMLNLNVDSENYSGTVYGRVEIFYLISEE